MALNVDKLREGLNDYNNSLNNHLNQLRNDFNSLMNFFMQFAKEYEGQAADDFKNQWERTARWFEEYMNDSSNLSQTLEERIQYLDNI